MNKDKNGDRRITTWRQGWNEMSPHGYGPELTNVSTDLHIIIYGKLADKWLQFGSSFNPKEIGNETTRCVVKIFFI